VTATANNPVVTGSAIDITATTATLVGTLWLQPVGTAFPVFFEYGTPQTEWLAQGPQTVTYESQVKPSQASPLTGDTTAESPPQTVTAQISNLAPGTTYHFRLTAAIAGSATYEVTGNDATFTTPAA
jgi:hypothetical protein